MHRNLHGLNSATLSCFKNRKEVNLCLRLNQNTKVEQLLPKSGAGLASSDKYVVLYIRQ